MNSLLMTFSDSCLLLVLGLSSTLKELTHGLNSSVEIKSFRKTVQVKDSVQRRCFSSTWYKMAFLKEYECLKFVRAYRLMKPSSSTSQYISLVEIDVKKKNNRSLPHKPLTCKLSSI